MIKPNVVTPELLTECVVDHICNPRNPTRPTPDAVKQILDFEASAFYVCYKDHWSNFLQLRDEVSRALTEYDAIELVEGKTRIKFSSNSVDESTLGILMVMLHKLCWKDIEVHSTGYYKGYYGSRRFYRSTYEMTLAVDHVKLLPDLEYCPIWEHSFVPGKYRDQVELIVGICGYVSGYDHVVLNDKQIKKYKEYRNAVSK